MSFLATTKIKEEGHTASYYRMLYLDDDIVFDKFYCPYCDIELDKKNIYKDKSDNPVRAPHFAVKKGGPNHSNYCEFATKTVNAIDSEKFGMHYEITNLLYPQVFIDRPESAPKTSIIEKTNGTTVFSIKTEAQKRVDYTISYVPKSYLLQQFIEVRNLFFKNAYKLQDKEKWSKEHLNDYINNELGNIPLAFSEDNKTNYRQAFIKVLQKAFVNFKKERIYYGDGHVKKTDDFYEIINNEQIFLENKINPFKVIVNFNITSNLKTNSQRGLIDLLEKTVEEQSYKVKWYARGLPIVNNNMIILYLKKIDYLYIKKIEPFKKN